MLLPKSAFPQCQSGEIGRGSEQAQEGAKEAAQPCRGTGCKPASSPRAKGLELP